MTDRATDLAAEVSAVSRGRQWETLVKRSDFLRIASGIRRVTPAFIVQAADSALPAPTVRVGFTASRKLGNAVARSRAKRRLRALADRVFTPTATDSRFDYVFVGRPDVLRRNFAVMERELRDALMKISAKSAERRG